MNKETKEFWSKFYILFGNDGCRGGWEELVKINLAGTTCTYPYDVWDHPKMIREGYCVPSNYDFSCVKFTDKFIKEIGEY